MHHLHAYDMASAWQADVAPMAALPAGLSPLHLWPAKPALEVLPAVRLHHEAPLVVRVGGRIWGPVGRAAGGTPATGMTRGIVSGTKCNVSGVPQVSAGMLGVIRLTTPNSARCKSANRATARVCVHEPQGTRPAFNPLKGSSNFPAPLVRLHVQHTPPASACAPSIYDEHAPQMAQQQSGCCTAFSTGVLVSPNQCNVHAAYLAAALAKSLSHMVSAQTCKCMGVAGGT